MHIFPFSDVAKLRTHNCAIFLFDCVHLRKHNYVHLYNSSATYIEP